MNSMKEIKVLDDGKVALIDWMGDDQAIVDAARISYGTGTKKTSNNRGLIRYLMRHRHSTPFEQVQLKFFVRIPMDAWRQFVRHRTQSINEYSTRYSEAIDSQQKTHPDQWRSQSKNNKQGSGNYLDNSKFVELPDHPNRKFDRFEHLAQQGVHTGDLLTQLEQEFHDTAKDLYNRRLECGVAREQARKDLPLSTYTEAYTSMNLHNLFHFLGLRMDSHAQYEIRQYAKAMYELIKPIVPIACEAFESYKLNSVQFSEDEMIMIEEIITNENSKRMLNEQIEKINESWGDDALSKRELKEFKEKLRLFQD